MMMMMMMMMMVQEKHKISAQHGLITGNHLIVPHSCKLKALDIYKVSPAIIKFLKSSMKLWNTNLFLNDTKGSDKININCGISQGDSLSPTTPLSLIPLTIGPNNTKYGYNIFEKTIKHLFYMDDLKLYA